MATWACFESATGLVFRERARERERESEREREREREREIDTYIHRDTEIQKHRTWDIGHRDRDTATENKRDMGRTTELERRERQRHRTLMERQSKRNTYKEGYREKERESEEIVFFILLADPSSDSTYLYICIIIRSNYRSGECRFCKDRNVRNLFFPTKNASIFSQHLTTYLLLAEMVSLPFFDIKWKILTGKREFLILAG